MARVEWTRQTGDDIETVVAMLLCSKHPNAVRVRPSQGDGGVDIFIPGPGGWAAEREVYQVKKYYENLVSNQKRKVIESYKRVLAVSAKEGWRITKWHLVMPLDLTGQNLGWLHEATKEADFPRETHGLLTCDTLASEYPNVIDYYLRDGKDRLQAAMNNLTALLSHRTRRTENEPLRPSDVTGDLASIHAAINQHDPFYRYELSTSEHIPSQDVAASDLGRGLVAAWAVRQNAVWITTKIFARSMAALEEQPLGIHLNLAVPLEGSPLREQVEKFIEYGAPLSMPAGTVTGSLDLPAGLGGELSHASLQMIPMSDGVEIDSDNELIIAMLAPDSESVVASTLIRRTEATSGNHGGFRGIWTDSANLFTLEILGNVSHQDLTLNFDVTYSLAGRRPSDIVDSLRFLAAKHGPNRLAFAAPYGPRRFMIGGSLKNQTRESDTARWSIVADALVRLQDHVPVRLLMPREMSRDEALRVIAAAKLVSGEAIEGTLSGSFTITRESDENLALQLDTVYDFQAIKAIRFALGDEEFEVGKESMFFQGRYTEIGDAEIEIEVLTDGVAVLYSGDYSAGRILAREPRDIPTESDESASSPD